MIAAQSRKLSSAALAKTASGLLAGFLLAALSATSPAQTPATPTFKLDANAVLVPVVVRDKHGKPITDLTKDDFSLMDGDKAETINYFAHDANLPSTVGLVIDTSRSVEDSLTEERTASQQFLDQMLNVSGDKAFVVQFDNEVDLLQDTTASKPFLHKALDQLAAPTLTPASSSGGSQAAHTQDKTFYDAVFLASSDLMGKQQGPKAIVLLTDGVDRGSKENLYTAIEAAQRANVAIYAIYFEGKEPRTHGNNHNNNNGNPGMGRRIGLGGGMPGIGGYPGGGYPGGGYPGQGGQSPSGSGGQRPIPPPSVDGKKILEQMCHETGGFMFEAKKQKVSDIYASLADDLRSEYVLGYTPDKSSVPGLHRLNVIVKKKGVSVQARSGFYFGH